MMELNLSKEQSLINLDLRKKDMVSLCLEKPILSNQKARVAVVMDYSGSMSSLYRNGTVQAVLERLLPIAMQFDDNAEMELWIFEDSFKRLPNITIHNFYGYVQREIIDKGYRMGLTNYAPAMKDIFQKYINEEPANIPNYILFITDGDNFDKDDTLKVLTEASKYPIFWQYVGIGSEKFKFLQQLDDMGGRYVDNANFFPLNDFQTISDSELYHKLLEEYPDWLAMPEVQQLIAGNIPQIQLSPFMDSNRGESKKKKKGLFGRFF